MKYIFKIYNIYGVLLICLFLLSVALMASCNKNNDLGVPEITSVRSVEASLADSTFDKALPGKLIVIEGHNLSNAREIYFNGYQATFNPVYNTNTNIIVQIPLKTPTSDKYPGVSGVIRLVTTHGTTEYRFAVNPPAPHLSYIYNENTRPGDTMEIYGSFLRFVDSVIFPGGISSADIEVNDSGTVIHVKVPANLKDAGPLRIVSLFGNDTTNYLVNNTKGPGLFANFNIQGDPNFGWAYWRAFRLNDNSLYPNSDGYYIQSKFKNVAANNYAWWADNRNIATLNTNKVVVPVSELGNSPAHYYLKFEINTRIPIVSGVMFRSVFQIKDGNDVYVYDFDPTKAFGKNDVFDTKNRWKTVKIALSNFKQPTIGTLLNPDGSGTLKDFHIGIFSGAEGIENFDAAFDNFRIEKINK